MIALLLHGALLTVGISLAGIVVGVSGGVLFGILSCNQFARFRLRPIIGGYVLVVRGTPLFIQLLLIYFALPEILGINLPPIAAGVITLGCNSTAYLTETVRAAINGLPKGQWEAAKALGYSPLQILRHIVLPQALSKALPLIANEACTLLKDSSILMVIGVPELTKVAKDIVARELKPMEIYLLAGGIYLAMTSFVGWLFRTLERRSYVAYRA